MTATMTKPTTTRRGADRQDVAPRLPLATDFEEYRVLLDRQTRLRAELETRREQLAAAESGDVASALASGRPVPTTSAADIRQAVADRERAVAQTEPLVEAARVGASRVEAQRVASQRAAIAQRILDRRAADDADLAELAAIDADFVHRGYRRPVLPGWQLLTPDQITGLKNLVGPLDTALREIVKEAGR